MIMNQYFLDIFVDNLSDTSYDEELAEETGFRGGFAFRWKT